ncbi:MAG: hypothetical protein FJ112_01380 [Deltaproteobacteria bacterium]|nr:hypothetical protein [Deltaproteobacteria bacterium]
MRFLLLVLWVFPVFGLTTQYVSFEHPETWRCELNQGVYICQGTQEPDRKESLVLSIATIAGEWDSLEAYEKYLKTPRTIQDDTGASFESKISYTRRRNINGINWIDSLQYNSELPGFWTRYTATVQNKLAILITYLVSDEHYSKMAPKFEKMIASLKPSNEFESSISSSQGKSGLPGNTILGPKAQKDLLSSRLNTKKNATAEPKANVNDSNDADQELLLLVAGGLVVALLLVKVMKKKKPKIAKGTKRA